MTDDPSRKFGALAAQDIASLPLLPDDKSLWRPGRYRNATGGTFTIGAVFERGAWRWQTDEEREHDLHENDE